LALPNLFAPFGLGIGNLVSARFGGWFERNDEMMPNAQTKIKSRPSHPNPKCQVKNLITRSIPALQGTHDERLK
jgi:hypothetical protein